MHKRVLITGGFGFIGGRLGQHLWQSGNQIVLGTRSRCSPPDWLPQAEVVQVDWSDPRVLERICSGIDMVIQAAGMNAQDCVADPVGALEINGLATARLVKAAVLQGVKRFIYLSTAHIYANPLVGTITEDTCPDNLHPYATSHRAGEDVVRSASQRNEIEGVVLRISNAFGVPVHKNVNCWMLLVNDLCRQAVKTRKLILHTNGLQQRDFLPMGEVCHAIEHVALRDFEPDASGVINLGAGISRSVLEMAQLIQQRCKLVLGFEPELLRSDAEVGTRPEILEYRTDVLKKMGFKTAVVSSVEIDDLLSFCSMSFGENKD